MKKNYKNIITKRAQSTEISEEEFGQRVNIIEDEETLKNLGVDFENSWYVGDQGRFNNSEDLSRIVNNNPDLHIVTTTEEDEYVLITHNREVHVNALYYQLATGDNDPNIYCVDDMRESFATNKIKITRSNNRRYTIMNRKQARDAYKKIAQMETPDFASAVTKIIEGTRELEIILHGDWNTPGLQAGFPSNWNMPLDELSHELEVYRDRHAEENLSDEEYYERYEAPEIGNNGEEVSGVPNF